MLEEKMNETPEQVFFKYAYPCSADLIRREIINASQKELLDHYFKNSKAPDRDLLEACFPNAIKRLKRFAEGKDYWTAENIRKYFLVHHNKVIDAKEGLYADQHSTQQMRDLCKVTICKVISKDDINGGVVYVVESDLGELNRISGKYLPDAKVGDKVSVHWRFAIEKL